MHVSINEGPSLAGGDDPGVRPAIGAVRDAGAAALLVGRKEGAPRVRNIAIQTSDIATLATVEII